MTHPTDELVKRLIDSTEWFHCDCEIKMECAARIEELSAALEAEKRHKLAITGDKINAVSELRQVKAELTTLKAELAEAVDFIQHVADGHPKDYSDFLARHQKETDT